jgi:clan AA aspartic protease
MIGQVAERRALVSLPFRRPDQPDISIEFVIDTGFSGSLTLPPAAVAAMQLPLVRGLSANLADDRDVLVAVHAATIVWDGQEREVEVLAVGKRPLLGTWLMERHELTVQFVDGGSVQIRSL